MHLILQQQLAVAAHHFEDFVWLHFQCSSSCSSILHTCSGTRRGGVRSLSVRLDAGSFGQAQGAAAVRAQRIQASAIAGAGGLVEPVHGDAGRHRPRGSSAVLMLNCSADGLMPTAVAIGFAHHLKSQGPNGSDVVDGSVFQASNLTCRKELQCQNLAESPEHILVFI